MRQFAILCTVLAGATAASTVGLIPLEVVSEARASSQIQITQSAAGWLGAKGYTVFITGDGTIWVEGTISQYHKAGLKNYLGFVYGNSWGSLTFTVASDKSQTIVVVSPTFPDPNEG